MGSAGAWLLFSGKKRKFKRCCSKAVPSKVFSKSLQVFLSQERQKAVQEHHKSPPNVVVAHVEDGIEIIHMYSGRPVCRLALQPQVLHADINGDGIPDHVHVKGVVRKFVKSC